MTSVPLITRVFKLILLSDWLRKWALFSNSLKYLKIIFLYFTFLKVNVYFFHCLKNVFKGVFKGEIFKGEVFGLPLSGNHTMEKISNNQFKSIPFETDK